MRLGLADLGCGRVADLDQAVQHRRGGGAEAGDQSGDPGDKDQDRLGLRPHAAEGVGRPGRGQGLTSGQALGGENPAVRR